MTQAIDFEAEGLLEGLEEDERAARLQLLERLHEQGVPLEELREAVQEGRLALLPARLIVGGQPRYTADDIAEQTGLDVSFFQRLRRVIGLPLAEADARIFTDEDLQTARLTAAFMAAGVSEDRVLEVARILGRGFAQAAEAMRAIAIEMALGSATSEAELAVNYANVVEHLMPMTGPLVDFMLRLHLRHVVQGELVSAVERQDGALVGAREIVVGFADLVGFTRLGETLPPDELGRVAERLEILTTDIVQPPVRLIKTIGDAAMIVSPEGAPLIDAMLDLVDAADVEGEDFPQLRAGVAAGQALNRAGDWYGRPVNLASRITDVARPGSVLATKELRDALRDDYRWSFAGSRSLKGVPDSVPLYRVRRLPGEDPADEDG